MNPRLRRLAADYQAIRTEYSGHPYVTVQPVGPEPPETYRVTYRVPGLRLHGETPVSVDEHHVEVRLPLSYPREGPYCVPITPLFHPNVSDHYCIADYWAAGETLVDVIAKLGDMIQFRIFNVKSPLDALAAYWAEQNPHLFPIGHIELGQPELDIELRSPSAPAPAMAVTEDDALSISLNRSGS